MTKLFKSQLQIATQQYRRRQIVKTILISELVIDLIDLILQYDQNDGLIEPHSYYAKQGNIHPKQGNIQSIEYDDGQSIQHDGHPILHDGQSIQHDDGQREWKWKPSIELEN